MASKKKGVVDIRTSKGAIRKTIVRNIEVPITQNQIKNKQQKNIQSAKTSKQPPVFKKTPSLFFPEEYEEIQLFISQQPNLNKEDNNNDRKKYLHTPELQTNLKLEREIEKLKRLNLDFEEQDKLELTPKTKSVLDKKVTKSLNYPPDKPVFKNLVKLNVNDSILLPSERIPIRTKYVSKGNQDPIPELADFLEPIQPLKLPKLPKYTRMPEVRKPVNDIWEQMYEIFRTSHPDE